MDGVEWFPEATPMSSRPTSIRAVFIGFDSSLDFQNWVTDRGQTIAPVGGSEQFRLDNSGPVGKGEELHRLACDLRVGPLLDNQAACRDRLANELIQSLHRAIRLPCDVIEEFERMAADCVTKKICFRSQSFASGWLVQRHSPGTDWLRLTPVVVPEDRVWTAKEDARYLSPWIGLPGRRQTVGMARHWHFLSVLFWVVNGVVFVALLSMEAAGSNLLENCPRCLGHLRVVCHFSHAARAQRLLPLQRAAATRLFQQGVHSRSAGHPERTVNVASAGEPVSFVSEIAGQPADRTLAALSGDARFRRVSDHSCSAGRHHWGSSLFSVEWDWELACDEVEHGQKIIGRAVAAGFALGGREDAVESIYALVNPWRQWAMIPPKCRRIVLAARSMDLKIVAGATAATSRTQWHQLRNASRAWPSWGWA
jgi:hypothetical protein